MAYRKFITFCVHFVFFADSTRQEANGGTGIHSASVDLCVCDSLSVC